MIVQLFFFQALLLQSYNLYQSERYTNPGNFFFFFFSEPNKSVIIESLYFRLKIIIIPPTGNLRFNMRFKEVFGGEMEKNG